MATLMVGTILHPWGIIRIKLWKEWFKCKMLICPQRLIRLPTSAKLILTEHQFGMPYAISVIPSQSDESLLIV